MPRRKATRNVLRYDIWKHLPSGEGYAVEFDNVGVTACYGPLHYEDAKDALANGLIGVIIDNNRAEAEKNAPWANVEIWDGWIN